MATSDVISIIFTPCQKVEKNTILIPIERFFLISAAYMLVLRENKGSASPASFSDWLFIHNSTVTMQYATSTLRA